MNDEALKEYYAIGWEVGLLDLVKDKVLRTNPYKFRILSAANFVKIDSNRQYKILDIGCGVGTTSFLIGENKKKHKLHVC